MAWKQFKKRVIEILIDDSSSFLTDEECEKWKEQRKERTELESERKRQERQLLDTWFEQEEYIKGSWWKRLWLRLVYAIKDTHGEGRLPDFVAKDIARCLLPSIIAYFESEEGKKAFAEWMEKKKCPAERKTCSAKQKGRGLILVLLHFRRFQPLNSYKKRIRTPCLLQSSSDTFVLVDPTGIEPVSENLLI